MVSPSQRRILVHDTTLNYGLSERRACNIFGYNRSSHRYSSVRKDDGVLRKRLKDLAMERRRFGYRRLGVLLSREGITCNHKKLFRIYREEGLCVMQRKGRKKATGSRGSLPVTDSVNQIWSIDFVSDALYDGRRFRVLSIVDQYSRECPALPVDTSMPGVRVIRELDKVIAVRGKPLMIMSDNGSEFISRAVIDWALAQGIEWHYITPGRPMENGYTESFNDKLRNECLNENWFASFAEAREIIEQWRIDYNGVRPHSSLGYKTPEEFAVKRQMQVLVSARLLEVAATNTCNTHNEKV